VNIKNYLESRGIQYWESGKNVTRGWINIRCVQPNCSDTSNHLGIKGRAFSCWKCGWKGNIKVLVKRLEEMHTRRSVKWWEVDKVLQLFPASENSETTHHPRIHSSPPIEVKLGQLEEIADGDWAWDYLIKRGFPSPEEIITKYRLKKGTHLGYWKFRIVAPIIENGTIVSAVGRSVIANNKRVIPYKTLSEELSIINPKHCLYGVDFIERRKAVLVEGIIDQWKMGNGSVALLGVKFTPEQVAKILSLKLKKLVILFDSEPEAQEQAEKLSGKVKNYIPEVEIVELSEVNDPGSISQAEAHKLLKELLF